MEPAKYQSNSHKSKEQKENPAVEKKVDKPITSKATLKKKGAAKKLSDIFVSEDVNSVGEYILIDIIVPTLKRLFVDIVSDGANMFAFGERGVSGRRSTAERYGYRPGYTNYNRVSERRDSRPATQRTRNAYSYDDISLETRGEAEAVLRRMEELIHQYDGVSVGDLYDLVDITGNFTDYRYGWTNLDTAYVERRRDGYVIRLPRAEALD